MAGKQCKYCKYCKAKYRSQGTYSSHGRKAYFCENPKTEELPSEAFGNKMPAFICFGENSYESKPQIKTAPRWCPERR